MSVSRRGSLVAWNVLHELLTPCQANMEGQVHEIDTRDMSSWLGRITILCPSYEVLVIYEYDHSATASNLLKAQTKKKKPPQLTTRFISGAFFG